MEFPGYQEFEWIEHHKEHLDRGFPNKLGCWFCTKTFSRFEPRMQHIRKHTVFGKSRQMDMKFDRDMLEYLVRSGLIEISRYHWALLYTTQPLHTRTTTIIRRTEAKTADKSCSATFRDVSLDIGSSLAETTVQGLSRLEKSPSLPAAKLSRPPRIGTPFKYEPLEDWKEQIRLLRILPYQSSAAEPIECEMTYLILQSDVPPFSAVSHRWGTSAPTVEILINGMPFMVRENVAALMVELRSKRQSLVSSSVQTEHIWIDAVCINQGNVLERNHQVKLMRSIYSTASETIVWLGSATHGSDLAIDHINGAFSDERMKAKTDHRKLTEPLQKLLGREYWTRIWVVQEVLLAKNIKILCGSKQFTWNSLEALCNTFRKKWLDASAGSPKRQAAEQIMDTGASILIREKREFGTSDSRQLSVLLDKFGAFKSTDPRDKVYGLLGLCEERHKIAIDYRKSLEEIYIDVIQSLGPMEKVADNLARAARTSSGAGNGTGFRPFPAQFFAILDLEQSRFLPLVRQILQSLDDESLLDLCQEQAGWFAEKFFWETEREFFWQRQKDSLTSRFSWESIELGLSHNPQCTNRYDPLVLPKPRWMHE
ncbi:hypothetical protein FOBRF1_013442 [Fusarium oxysporum]